MIRLILFLIASVMMAGGTSLAENVSPCSADVDMVPIQIMYAGKHDKVTTISDVKIDDYPRGFSNFVTAVTEHVTAKLAQENLCLSSAESRERSRLQFVAWSLNLANPPKPVPPLKARSFGVCRISSPWIDLAIEREPVPSVRGIIRYNERQLLTDQAVLAGARNVPPGVAMPVLHEEFERYADLEYMPSEIMNKAVKKPLDKRVPPDLLWLFRRADQELFEGIFWVQAVAALNTTMEIGEESYTKIVIALIDRCFESDGADIHYRSILDIKDSTLLEQYKITAPIATKFEMIYN